MNASEGLSVREFINLVKELNEHEAELKIRLAKEGVAEQSRSGAGAPSSPSQD